MWLSIRILFTESVKEARTKVTKYQANGNPNQTWIFESTVTQPTQDVSIVVQNANAKNNEGDDDNEEGDDNYLFMVY